MYEEDLEENNDLELHNFEIILNDVLIATAKNIEEAENYYNYQKTRLEEKHNNESYDGIDELILYDIDKCCEIKSVKFV